MSHWEALGQSDEWHTPKHVFDALGCRFDMDVAAPYFGPVHVPVPGGRYYWNHSLDQHWRGFVWMNPPFGGRNGLIPWLDKFFAHGDGIALVPDRTSAPWFQAAFPRADAILFTRKIRFLRSDGTEGRSPSNGTALLGVGPQAMPALKRAATHGFGILAGPLSA